MILQKISLTLLLVVENLLAVELANKTLGLETVSIVKLWVLSRPRSYPRNPGNPNHRNHRKPRNPNHRNPRIPSNLET